ncbi:expressed unknown protein [Seminavis robusta]|uniref:Shugoshin C-terminal domain-containing protein n=1 Tax=Seminavis robusta TaxID=568900 RepID=A0A9N8E1N4_9STRA|nr:expressed unknown protein [Seminavis robusta]|eukprot:Sro530_g161190.1 n/a (846) ;mRNA; r:26402-29122
MKRAAGQIRKVRRNKGGDKDGGSLDGASDSQEHVAEKPARRKPTAEEAALTAKNYRLAKELSDLRVRHREENKNVSRLTMENMNLATRWREAINHIGMLKKELAMQKHRTNEALTQLQRQKALACSPQSQGSLSLGQSPTNSLVEVAASRGASGVFQDVAAEMDKMDRLIAAHQTSSSPPPLPRASSSFDETPSFGAPSSPIVMDVSNESIREIDGEEKKTQESMDQPITPSPEKDDSNSNEEFNDNEHGGVNYFAPFKDAKNMVDVDSIGIDDPPFQLSPAASVTPSESPPPSPPNQTDSPSEDLEDKMPQQNSRNGSPSSLFPMTASPVLGRSKVFNESYPGDITRDVTAHPRSAERRPAADFKDIQEEDDSAIVSSTSMGSSKAQPPPLPLSSIAAFDASFATPFPDSFSPADESNKSDDKKTSTSPEPNGDEYNPFFPSPRKDEQQPKNSATSNSKSQSENSSVSSAGMSRRGQADNAPSPVFNGRPRTAVASGLFTSTTSITGNTVDTRRRPTPSFDNPANTSTPNQWNRGVAGLTSGDTGSIDAKDHASSGVTRYQTPPHGNRSPESTTGMDSEGPKRPEKTGAAAARARYEKALQPRGFTGGSRRFPRRADREEEQGASPVSAPSVSLAENKVAAANDISGGSSNHVVTQSSRVKERAASFAGMTTVAPVGDKRVTRGSWAARPSPTDSVGSKPWDEEVGDIPMSTSSSSIKSAEASSAVGHRTNGVSSFTGNSPSANSVRSSYARRLLERNRPWDKTSPKQETAPNVSTVSVQHDDLPQSKSDSPESRFIEAGRSRRRVKQPISYAEPSLGAKLRQGDVYFPKEDPGTRPATNPVHL